MKIMAKVREGEYIYILSARAQEINLLAGQMICEAEYDDPQMPSIIGTEFNIVKAFDQIHRNDRRKSEVESLRATLKAILVGLDMIEPLIEEPKPEEASAE